MIQNLLMNPHTYSTSIFFFLHYTPTPTPLRNIYTYIYMLSPTIPDNHYISATNQLIPAMTTELILFCLLISGNYIGELFSCNIQRTLSKNRVYKHILGILTLYFFVTALDDKKILSPITYMLSSFLTYTWFVIITLTPKFYTFLIMSILLFIYLFNDIDNHFHILKSEHKFILFSTLFFTTIVISIVGCYKYYNIKAHKFGNKFNISKFFFGKNTC